MDSREQLAVSTEKKDKFYDESKLKSLKRRLLGWLGEDEIKEEGELVSAMIKSGLACCNSHAKEELENMLGNRNLCYGSAWYLIIEPDHHDHYFLRISKREDNKYHVWTLTEPIFTRCID